jgi:glycogen operon protein
MILDSLRYWVEAMHEDGVNDNRSWNCGVEGPSDDPAVETLRNRQVKNLLTVTIRLKT